MLSVLTVVLPVYLLIVIGFAAIRLGYFPPSQVGALTQFVLRVPLPVLIVLALGTSPLDEVLRPGFTLAYAGASVATFALGYAYFNRLRQHRSPRAAVEAMGMSVSNSVFLGLPIVTLVMGEAVAVPILATALVVENAVVVPLGIALAEAGRGGGARGAFLKTLARLRRNPLLIAVLLGLLMSAFRIQLPQIVLETMGLLRPAAAPLALFAVGATVATMRLGGVLGTGAPVAAGKLFLHPLLTFGALLIVPGLPRPVLEGGTLNAAMASFAALVVIADGFGQRNVASAALVGATGASVITVSALIWLLGVT